MPKQTVIARVSDGLILCASAEWQELGTYEKQAKEIVKKLGYSSPKVMQIDSGPCYFIYLIVGDIVYLTLCDKTYPRKLAYTFLEELAKEFDIQYGNEAKTAKRSYQCIKFDNFITKTNKLYLDLRSPRNVSKISEDLKAVHNIMTGNIKGILERGEKISSVMQKSDELLMESKRVADMAKRLNYNLMLRKWGPVVGVVLVVLLVLYFRYFW
jgi:vesicle transport protein SEC22